MPPKKRKLVTTEDQKTARVQRRVQRKAQEEAEAAEKKAGLARWMADGTITPIPPIHAPLPPVSAEYQKRREEAMQADVEKYKKRLQTRQAEEQESQYDQDAFQPIPPGFRQNSHLTRVGDSTSSPIETSPGSYPEYDSVASGGKQAKSDRNAHNSTMSFDVGEHVPTSKGQTCELETDQSRNSPQHLGSAEEAQKLDDVLTTSHGGLPRIKVVDTVTPDLLIPNTDGSQQKRMVANQDRNIIFRANADYEPHHGPKQVSCEGVTDKWNLRQRVLDTLNDQG